MATDPDEFGQDPPPHDLPTNAELTERLTRVEQKQDHVVETVDNIEKQLEERGDQHDKMWHLFQAVKWGAVTLSGGGVLALLLQLLAGS